MIHNLFNRAAHKLAYFMPGGYKVRPAIHRLRGVQIGKHVWISQYVYIDELNPEAVTIGDNSTIGLRTSIFTHFYWGSKRSVGYMGKVHIDENVFVGPHCVILPKVHIGKNSVIQAGTVVSRNVPPDTLWGLAQSGPIARVTVPLTHEYSYEEFIKGLRPIRKNEK